MKNFVLLLLIISINVHAEQYDLQTVKTPRDVLLAIGDGVYASPISAGGFPDANMDRAKFLTLKTDITLALETYCKADALAKDNSHKVTCASINALDTQLTIGDFAILRGATGPVRSMAMFIGRTQCEYWGSEEMQQNTSALKTFGKTLFYLVAYPILQTKTGVQMIFLASKQYKSNQELKAWTAVVPAAGVSASIAIVAYPAVIPQGFVDGIAKAFGKNDLIERNPECRELGWFN